VRDVRGDGLDGHGASEHRVLRFPHLPGAADADAAEQLVAAAEHPPYGQMRRRECADACKVDGSPLIVE
jgi:hypothetical protein